MNDFEKSSFFWKWLSMTSSQLVFCKQYISLSWIFFFLNFTLWEIWIFVFLEMSQVCTFHLLPHQSWRYTFNAHSSNGKLKWNVLKAKNAYKRFIEIEIYYKCLYFQFIYHQCYRQKWFSRLLRIHTSRHYIEIIIETFLFCFYWMLCVHWLWNRNLWMMHQNRCIFDYNEQGDFA